MIDIYDNFIPLITVKSVEHFLISSQAWYFSWDEKQGCMGNRSVSPDVPGYSLGTARNREQFNQIDNFLLSFLNKEFNTSKITRVFINCFGRGDVTQWHTDPGGKSYMIYLNSEWKRHWGAPTSFKNQRKIYPKPGRLVVFSADIEHKGNAPTIFMPKYFPGRFSMVFQERS